MQFVDIWILISFSSVKAMHTPIWSLMFLITYSNKTNRFSAIFIINMLSFYYFFKKKLNGIKFFAWFMNHQRQEDAR